MKIDLVKVAKLMNRYCNARLNLDLFEGKYMIEKDGDWDIVNHKELDESSEKKEGSNKKESKKSEEKEKNDKEEKKTEDETKNDESETM